MFKSFYCSIKDTYICTPCCPYNIIVFAKWELVKLMYSGCVHNFFSKWIILTVKCRAQRGPGNMSADVCWKAVYNWTDSSVHYWLIHVHMYTNAYTSVGSFQDYVCLVRRDGHSESLQASPLGIGLMPLQRTWHTSWMIVRAQVVFHLNLSH